VKQLWKNFYVYVSTCNEITALHMYWSGFISISM